MKELSVWLAQNFVSISALILSIVALTISLRSTRRQLESEVSVNAMSVISAVIEYGGISIQRLEATSEYPNEDEAQAVNAMMREAENIRDDLSKRSKSELHTANTMFKENLVVLARKIRNFRER